MKLRGADVLARSLAAAGLQRVFALSGNHIMPVYDAALDAALVIVHVRHEGAAVHMADAWARTTGQTGIALVTGGPGHANAVGALYTALAADSPVVLLSGHAPLAELGRGAFQEMRQADVAAPLVKAAWTAQSAQTLGEDVARAVRTANAGRPGPVHLSLPSDVLDALAEGGVPDHGAFVPPPALMDERTRNEVLQAIGAAARPLLIAGPQFARRGGRAALADFEAASGVPAFVMESPRGVNDPALGLLAEVLARADCVFLLGKQADFTLRFGAAFAPGCRVLALGEGVEAMPALRQLGALPKRGGDWLREVRAALAYRTPSWATQRSAAQGPVHPVELCREVQKLLDATQDGVLVSDGGEIGQWAQACLSAPHRLINGVAGAIGPGLPFAIAAKLALPDSTVVAMMGDGTCGFHIAEFDTAARYGLPFVAVVGNDATWNAEYQIQLRSYGEARAHGMALAPRTRYDLVAQALGGHGEFVARPDELPAALERAVRSGKPACVNVMIERHPAPVCRRD